MEKRINMDLFGIEHNFLKPQKGRILISEPFSDSEYFKRSIVLLTEYSRDGTVGFILNKPVLVTLDQLLDDFDGYTWKIWMGGPVNTDRIYYVHTLGDKLIPDSLHVKDNIYWGGSFDIVRELIKAGKVTESEIRFFVGYSGWDLNQLESEIKRKYWMVSQIDSVEIMNPAIDVWQTAVKTVGSKYHIWEHFPVDPTYN
jgi:putative transcriptional regulator